MTTILGSHVYDPNGINYKRTVRRKFSVILREILSHSWCWKHLMFGDERMGIRFNGTWSFVCSQCEREEKQARERRISEMVEAIRRLRQ